MKIGLLFVKEAIGRLMDYSVNCPYRRIVILLEERGRNEAIHILGRGHTIPGIPT
ncbi:MAG: hypothetical protein ACOCSE_02755 [Chitinivibrionales bacterium]